MPGDRIRPALRHIATPISGCLVAKRYKFVFAAESPADQLRGAFVLKQRNSL
jgi:hypothetical protein